MASIVFRPTCSSCKKFLESAEINVKEKEDEIPVYIDNFRTCYKFRSYIISPCKCPNCGAIFNNLIAPGAIHFPISDNILMSHAEQ